MTAWDRFANAAMEFARADCELARLRKFTGRCTEKSMGNEAIGDSGSPPCNLYETGEFRCDNCQSKFDNRDIRKSALRRRSQAASRMRRWYPEVSASNAPKGNE